MPSRIVSLLIIVFWLACMSWLFVREVWPRLWTGEPPRFVIGHMDDTQRAKPVEWTAIFRSGGVDRIFTVTTTVEWDGDSSTFAFRSHLEPPRSQRAQSTEPLRRLATSYRIDSEGLMVSFTADLEIVLDTQHSASFEGTVRGSDCEIRWDITTLRGDANRGTAEVEVSRTGTVLLPLHPLSRIKGLTAGRRWGLPMLNPLHVSAIPGRLPQLAWVNAEVRDAPETLEWGRHARSCWVIDYEGEEVRGAVWVEEGDDARVLRIEFRLGEDLWIVTRNEAARK